MVRIVVVRSDRNLHRQRAYQKVSVFLNVQYVQNDCTRVRLSPVVIIVVCDAVCAYACETVAGTYSSL